MKLITRDTDYAFRALCFIAKQKDKIVAVPELVAALKIPRPFLRKILQRLNKKKVLKSYRGLGGGFLLNMDPEKLSLAGLIGIFQGPVQLSICFFKKARCPNIRTCALKKKIAAIEEHVVNELESITLASLLGRDGDDF